VTGRDPRDDVELRSGATDGAASGDSRGVEPTEVEEVEASATGAEAAEPETPAEVEAPATEADAPEARPVEDELTAARRERDDYLGLAQRTQADFENYRKRAVRDNAAAGSRAKAALVRELLPVVDNLERALLAAGEGEEGLADGVRLVLTELHGVLERTGVEPIEAHRAPFDPRVHEALTTRVEEGTQAGVVLDVAQKGYRLGDALIRPARVVVSA
jgi:molecular chaperone GrpE